jgi:hypothetical protein
MSRRAIQYRVGTLAIRLLADHCVRITANRLEADRKAVERRRLVFVESCQFGSQTRAGPVYRSHSGLQLVAGLPARTGPHDRLRQVSDATAASTPRECCQAASLKATAASVVYGILPASSMASKSSKVGAEVPEDPGGRPH